MNSNDELNEKSGALSESCLALCYVGCCNTQGANITAVAWDVSLLPDTDSGSDVATSRSTESVVDSTDSNDNVYDVCYDVREYEDTDMGSSRVANLEASWAVGIG